MMAQHEIKDGARLFLPQAEANLGHPQCEQEFAKDIPTSCARVIAYEEARNIRSPTTTSSKRPFIGVTGLGRPASTSS